MPKKRVDFNLLNTTAKVDGLAPVAGAFATDAVINESRVDVLLMIDGDWNGETDTLASHRVVRIKVWSKNKPGLFSYTDFRVPGKSRDEMARACEFGAAALAERQIILYMDNHDPAECAKMGKKHFLELCEHMARKPG